MCKSIQIISTKLVPLNVIRNFTYLVYFINYTSDSYTNDLFNIFPNHKQFLRLKCFSVCQKQTSINYDKSRCFVAFQKARKYDMISSVFRTKLIIYVTI